jgi:phosphoribosyl-ATP pyrophosphohydrolase
MDGLLTALDKVLAERRTASPDSSYVASLHAEGSTRFWRRWVKKPPKSFLPPRMRLRAVTPTHWINEVADLWFHTMVMLGHLDLDHSAVLEVLDDRMGLSGLAEKAARKGHNAPSESA